MNWNALKSAETIVGESSLYILIKALINMKVNNVILVGFDGFSRYAKNYYDKTQQFYQPQENISQVTTAIIEQIAEFQKYIRIDFLTESSYKIKEEKVSV